MIAIIWDSDFFYQWPSFVLLAIIYSALVGSGELSKDGPRIFAKTNTRPFSTILAVHAAFLAILFAAWRLASFIDPLLPGSMTSRVGRGGSLFNILFIFGMLILQFIERRSLVVERGTRESD